MGCPFLDKPYKQCLPYLTFDNVDWATQVCGDDFTACPIFSKNLGKLKSKWRKVFRRDRLIG